MDRVNLIYCQRFSLNAWCSLKWLESRLRNIEQVSLTLFYVKLSCITFHLTAHEKKTNNNKKKLMSCTNEALKSCSDRFTS